MALVAAWPLITNEATVILFIILADDDLILIRVELIAEEAKLRSLEDRDQKIIARHISGEDEVLVYALDDMGDLLPLHGLFHDQGAAYIRGGEMQVGGGDALSSKHDMVAF